MIKRLYNFRKFLWGSLWSDLRYRYAGTVIGFYWFFINPLFEILIYTVVFSHLLSLRAPGRDSSYTLFLITGLFPWLSYSEAIIRGTNSLLQNASYLRRMAIPGEIFIAKNSLLALISMLIYTIIIILYFLFSGQYLGISLLLLPVIALLLHISAFGVALITANLMVLFPDIGEIIPTLLQLWRWLLPVMYAITVFPKPFQKILKLNPPYYFIESFRAAFLENTPPTIEAWAYMLFWAMLSLSIGLFFSEKLRSDVIDEL